jgi:hypothetical protein
MYLRSELSAIGAPTRELWRQLRQKLEADPAQPVYLVMDTGVGYRLLND